MRLWFLGFIAVSALAGCATSSMSQRDYARSVAQIELGMSKPEFIALFPSAQPRGARQYPSGAVEVFELVVSGYSFVPSGNPSYERNVLTGTESRVTWFYFYEGRLIQYGTPDDWPARPDQLIEVRVR